MSIMGHHVALVATALVALTGSVAAQSYKDDASAMWEGGSTAQTAERRGDDVCARGDTACPSAAVGTTTGDPRMSGLGEGRAATEIGRAPSSMGPSGGPAPSAPDDGSVHRQW